MKTRFGFQISLFISFLAFIVIQGCIDSKEPSKAEFDRLKSGFINPSDTNKVWCYWYWLNDDISKEGVTKDLEAMKEVGIGAAFIGNINPNEVNGRVPLFSEEWWEIMVHAVNEGKRLGIDIGTFNCPGWSQSGGPWVKPEMAMRYLTYTETAVVGGGKVSVNLPKAKELFQDVYVLAVPDRSHLYQKIENDNEVLFTTNTSEDVSIELEQAGSLRANTLLLYPAKAQLKADCELFAWNNEKYESIKTFIYDRSNHSTNVGPDAFGPVSVSLPGMKSGKFRLVIKNLASNEKAAGFSKIVLSEEVMLESYVEKQLGKMHPTPFPAWGTYLWKNQVNSGMIDAGIPKDEIIDISQYMNIGGNLEWEAPAGKWLILRFGMTPTGTENSPAAPQGKGYEIDKASTELVRYHFDNYVGELLKRIPAESRSALKYVIADSYEMGSQNWTDGYASKFEMKFGYDPKKYFPVLSGRIVGSVEESERFLWDLRRSISDDIAYEYVGGLRQISNENNLKIWLENYGHWGFPSEFLLYGGQSDLVSGEFWNEGELGNIECKAASSSAHIYGKKVTSAEAFTAAGRAYSRYPEVLKRRGDWSFTEGINHFVLHVYIHQPDEARVPGVNAWFSTEFNRNNTWFSQGKAWIDYLRRCQHMLQQGKYAADVCYFIGDDAPKMIGVKNPELPFGYSYDYINSDVILNRLSIKDGKFVLPDGMSYRIMVLPQLTTIRPEVLKKIMELVKEGGVILGPKAEKSPSLKDYPAGDDQVKLISDELWGMNGGEETIRSIGKGKVMRDLTLSQAFTQLNIDTDFHFEGKQTVLWTHRTQPGMEIYFITNQGNKTIKFEPSFRVTGMQPQLWDAVTGKIRLLNEFTERGHRTFVPIEMEAGQSWFVIFTRQSGGITDNGFASNFPEKKDFLTIKGPWSLTFANKEIGPADAIVLDTLEDLAKSNTELIKFYSGTITYTTEFDLGELPTGNQFFLDLGEVSVIARVRINGSEPISLWMDPWTAEIGDYLKIGRNTLEIEVANLWRNRLIFDHGKPAAEKKSWVLISDITAGEEPPSSGLIGPVKLVVCPINQ